MFSIILKHVDNDKQGKNDFGWVRKAKKSATPADVQM
jgi:hypothetical protein